MTDTDTNRPATTPTGDRWGRIPAWWLDHPELDADGLAVLAALSTYADESGVCWPSQATLAAKLKRSRPTVNRIVGRLESIGLIAVEHRNGTNGGRLSCRYRLRLSQPMSTTVTAPDSKADSPCSSASHEQHHPEQIPDSLSGREPRPSIAASEVSADWTPSDADRRWATKRFPDAELDQHAELFVRRCQAHGYRYRDIGAAWRSWLLQDLAPQPTRPTRRAVSDQKAPTRGEAAEHRVSAWASVAARLNGASSATSSPWV